MRTPSQKLRSMTRSEKVELAITLITAETYLLAIGLASFRWQSLSRIYRETLFGLIYGTWETCITMLREMYNKNNLEAEYRREIQEADYFVVVMKLL